jgi:DNA modification methylase
MEVNSIYCGNNLEILQKFPDKSVDLIYADPPFFSGRNYEVIWGDNAEIRQFDDRFKGDIDWYVEWMVMRLQQCHRVLKDTGSMYLHCDWHASAYLRIAMDRIFGYSHFINEIIWRRTNYTKSSQYEGKKFSVLSDTIYFYTKSNNYIFNLDSVARKLTEEEIEQKYNKKDDLGYYRVGSVLRGESMGDRLNLCYEYKGYKPKTCGWRVSLSKLTEIDQNGNLGWSKNGIPYRKHRIDEEKGIAISNIWDDITRTSNIESVHYPTQKPEALLKRIIEASSNKDDLVLDPFCGCGTAIAVAHQLQRRWIGIDVSPTACTVMQRRLAERGHVQANIIGLPATIEHLKSLEPFEFQNWIVNKIGGVHNNKKTGDGGVDGWTLEVLNNIRLPIQVKQSECVGRNVIDNFETAIRRVKKDKGIIYAFSFCKGAYEETARARTEDNVDIQLVSVSTLLGGA